MAAAPEIHEDIRRASTLPGAFYARPENFELARERVFRRAWHLVGDLGRVKVPGAVFPTPLLEGCLEEPLLLTRDAEDRVHCLSNVCTHRGALLCEGEGTHQFLRCRYHGRRFGLDGKLQSMPEFDGVEGFPSPADDLPRPKTATWRQFIFAALDPAFPLEALTAEMDRRAGWLPIERAVFDPSRSRDYLVRANWALYCDNYLEEFHIPFVHAGLVSALDFNEYRTELFEYSSLQLAVAAGGEESFEPPPGAPEHGKRVAAYYFWLFPNLMFNFYPWGLSINIVKPLAQDRTKVSFLSYVWDASKMQSGAGGALDRVEREDEAVVESVQKGVASRLYRSGRFSPKRETGVHHFHRLLSRFMREGA